MAALTDLTLAQARDGLAAGEFTSVELTEAHIAATEAVRDLNCYILETPEAAREMAQAADDRRVRGEGGSLNGLPIAIKDLFCTTGVQAPVSLSTRYSRPVASVCFWNRPPAA